MIPDRKLPRPAVEGVRRGDRPQTPPGATRRGRPWRATPAALPLPLCQDRNAGPDRANGAAAAGLAAGVDRSEAAASQRPRNRLRVVVVEDEAIISLELEFLLEELGAEVVGTAMSAAEAHALVATQRPDCLTMDISIKGDRDGIAAACDIYAAFGIRSIFVSAYGDADTLARAAPANPIGFVRKPVEKEALAEMLERVARPQV